ncbi:hypothetical protein K438DRAFT_1772279 [Mycena galopus ATCC 62051]|nr:hypothetical protein K438DRAFT_1772279 [Mycena galopus ATCC 62051]
MATYAARYPRVEVNVFPQPVKPVYGRVRVTRLRVHPYRTRPVELQVRSINICREDTEAHERFKRINIRLDWRGTASRLVDRSAIQRATISDSPGDFEANVRGMHGQSGTGSPSRGCFQLTRNPTTPI